MRYLHFLSNNIGCNYDSLNLEEDTGIRLIPRSLVVVTGTGVSGTGVSVQEATVNGGQVDSRYPSSSPSLNASSPGAP